MRVRFYSPPFFGGLPNVGCSVWISYVYAENGGGGDIKARTVEYDSTDPNGFVNPVMSRPSPEEIFTVEGVNREQLQSGDGINLRTSDGHYVGIDHDEEDRHDYLVASKVQPLGVGETFIVTFLDNETASSLDPCGPSYTVALLGHNGNYLSFPNAEGGPLVIDTSSIIGHNQKLALDYLPDLVASWYSKRQGETVHHDNTKCTEGNNIEAYNRAQGTGGLPQCKHCAQLDKEGR